MKRMDAEFIRNFRLRYKTDFIRDVAGILEEVSQEPDPVQRRILARDRAHSLAKLDAFPIKLGRSLDQLLKLLSPVTLGWAKALLPSLDAYVQERLPEADPTRRSRWRYALRKRVTRPWEEGS